MGMGEIEKIETVALQSFGKTVADQIMQQIMPWVIVIGIIMIAAAIFLRYLKKK